MSAKRPKESDFERAQTEISLQKVLYGQKLK